MMPISFKAHDDSVRQRTTPLAAACQLVDNYLWVMALILRGFHTLRHDKSTWYQ
jgi:hypothetical protein